MIWKRYFPWILIVILALLPRLISFGIEGHLWDEYFYYDASRQYLHSAAAGNFSPTGFEANFEHPPLGKYVLWPGIILNHLLDRLDSASAYDLPRLMIVFLSLATILFVGFLGTRLFSRKVGILAAFILAFLPSFIAYSRIIDLDITLTFFATLSVGMFLLASLENKPKLFLWSGVFAGLAQSTKNSAIFLLPLFLLLLLLFQWKEIKKRGRVILPWQILFTSAFVLFIPLLLWPFLWQNTVGNLARSLAHWSGRVEEIFLGIEREGPFYYFFLYFLVTTPLLLFLPFFTALKKRDPLKIALALWFLVPFLISFPHLHQGGVRYIIWGLPPFALLVATGIENLSQRFKPAPVIFALYLLLTTFFVHPYYLDYYNEAVGFTKTVERKKLFNVGFYGQGVREAVEYINRQGKEGERVHLIIVPDDAPWLKEGLVRDDFGPSQWLVTNIIAEEGKRELIPYSDYNEVYQVEVFGAPLARVYRRK